MPKSVVSPSSTVMRRGPLVICIGVCYQPVNALHDEDIILARLHIGERKLPFGFRVAWDIAFFFVDVAKNIGRVDLAIFLNYSRGKIEARTGNYSIHAVRVENAAYCTAVRFWFTSG